MKLFEDKTELLEEMLEAGMKEQIAQDVASINVGDIGVLIELYKNDKQFRKFLVNVFLDKLYSGHAISSFELTKAVLNTLDLKEYRSEIIKYMLNTEHFYSTKIAFKLRLL